MNKGKEKIRDIVFLECLVKQGEKMMVQLLLPWAYMYGPTYILGVTKEGESWDGLSYPVPKCAYGYIRNTSRIQVVSEVGFPVEKREGDFIEASSHLVPAMVDGAKRMLKKRADLVKRQGQELPHINLNHDNTEEWNLWTQAWQIRHDIHAEAMHELVLAYEPYMRSAYMEVPE